MTATDVDPQVDEIEPASAAPTGDRSGAAARERPASSFLAGVGLVVVALAALAAWFLVDMFVVSNFQEHATQSRLYDRMRAGLAATTAPLGPPIAAGTPVSLLSAPSIGMHDLVVVEGTTAAELTKGPGHLQDTPLPGQVGTSVLFGRSVTYGAPFGKVASLRRGAVITAVTGEGVFSYRVVAVEQPGSVLPPAAPSGGGSLVLVTSAAHGWRSGWAPDHVVEVDATLVKPSAIPLTAALPAGVPKDATAMQGDNGDLISLVLWLQGLLVVAVAGAWCLLRWGGRATWLAGIPLLLLMLWGATGAASLLLPNLV